jgi:glycosyltransferase involved in cell wall biosynthesis
MTTAELSPPQIIPARETETPEPMSGENIVCFAKDWFEDPTSNNHVMTELARRNKVLWLNSISTRTPNFSSGRDITKIFRKLAGFFKGVTKVRENLWVYTPIVIPLPHSKIAAALNRWILALTISLLRKKLGMRQFQLWSFIPNTADYIGKLGESVSVYYCVDEWSKFSYVDGPKLAAAENRLCKSVDVVFATSKSLVDGRKQLNPETHLARHGVDHDLFANSLDGSLTIPPDVANLPNPILGFYGTIQDWLDQNLIAYLAERHTEWSIVLIGKAHVDASALKKYPNIHLFGRRPHAELPAYCRAFSAGLIPQKINELTIHMNPIKLREYLSAGLPVIATALPEVAEYSSFATAAQTYEQFERAVIEAIQNDSPELRRQRSDAMKNQTWHHKVADVSAIVMRVKNEKVRTH